VKGKNSIIIRTALYHFSLNRCISINILYFVYSIQADAGPWHQTILFGEWNTVYEQLARVITWGCSDWGRTRDLSISQLHRHTTSAASRDSNLFVDVYFCFTITFLSVMR